MARQSRGIFGSYTSFTLDKGLMTKYMAGKMRNLLNTGMTAWVDEAKNTVPVWSGGERAALTQIAAYVGVPVFGPGSASRVAHDTPRNDIDPKIDKAQRQAEGRASERFSVQESGIGASKIFFRWTSTLPYFNFNERQNANEVNPRSNLINPGPYFMRQRANDAWDRAVREEIRINPFRVKNMFRIRRFKIGA